MSDKIKTLQSRAKRNGLTVTREDIRTKIAAKFGEEFDLENADISVMYEAIFSGLAVSKPSALSNQEKEEEILVQASELKIDLPVEAITQIANSVDWAISSRVEMMQQLRVALQQWADYKLEEASQLSSELERETNQLFNGVKNRVQSVVNEDNKRLIESSESLSREVEQSVSKFQESSARIFKLFEVPS